MAGGATPQECSPARADRKWSCAPEDARSAFAFNRSSTIVVCAAVKLAVETGGKCRCPAHLARSAGLLLRGPRLTRLMLHQSGGSQPALAAGLQFTGYGWRCPDLARHSSECSLLLTTRFGRARRRCRSRL